MLEWEHGIRTGWASRPPHNGSRIAGWAAPDIAAAIAACWAEFSIAASIEALRNSIRLFDRASERVAKALVFDAPAGRRAAAEVDRILARPVG
jgi:hypothetical protein